MIRIRAAVVDLLLRMLDPIERDVVDGDFRELRVSRTRAIRELLGLVARRQVAAWLDWRPWAALVLVVLPLGMVVSLVSRHWALNTAIYAWFYVDNWTPAYLASAGARSDLLHVTTEFFVRCAALMLWAWTVGFAAASASRRTVWETYALFGLVSFGGTVGSTTVGVLNPANAAVFSQTLYRVGFPIVFRTVLVLFPALHGMRKAAGEATLTWVHAAALAVSVILVTAVVAPGTQVAVTFGWWSSSADSPAVQAVFQLRRSWQLRLLPFAMTLPATYVFFNTSWRSWRQRTQPS
jgi:hypothetical protein